MGPVGVGLGVEIHAAGVELNGLGLQVGVAVDGIGEQAGALGVGQQPLAPRVVGVVHADIAAIKQNGLGIAVGLHGAVEVQMVLTEIGEDAHGEAHTVDAVQHQRVGGDLHDHVGAAGVGHLAEQPLQLEGLRRGALRGERLLATPMQT